MEAKRFFRNLMRDLFSIFCSQTQKAVLYDFQKERNRILEKNSRYIIQDKLVPYIIHTNLYENGYLMTEKEAYAIAIEMFIRGRATGKIDSMNRLVKKELA